MDKIMTIILIILAAICYAINVVLTMDSVWVRSIFQNSEYSSFFGRGSWMRKYKEQLAPSNKFSMLVLAPKNWYYRTFNLKYKEKFPGSATIFVFLTDGMHFFQFLFITFVCLSIAVQHQGLYILYYFLLYRITWFLVFGLFFEHVLVKKEENEDLQES